MRRFLLAALLFPAIVQADVRYRLAPDPAAQSLTVSMTIDHPAATEKFCIPAWTPGFYILQPYQTKISDFKATDADGKKLEFTHDDSRAWIVTANGAREITVSYRVLGDELGLGIMASTVQSDSAFVNGPSAFVYNPSRMKEPITLEVVRPTGWEIAIPLEENDNHQYQAADYDELVDSPIQLGKMVRRSFKVGSVPAEAVFVASPGETLAPDPDVEVKVMAQVAAPVIQMFKGAPFKHYLYIVHLSSAGFQGGLEHRAAQVLALSNQRNLAAADLYCHEFFHAWNVKQMRPAVLGPFDYSAPCRTTNLWFAEGVTDYYAKLLTYKSGAQDRVWFLGELSDQYQTYEFGVSRKSHTLEEASRTAWEHGGFSLGDLDYYNKGLLAGLLFDAVIRKETKNEKSLDDVMRLLYSRYRLPHPGYPEDGILKAINEVAGKDLSTLYTKMMRTTDPLPYELLKNLGLRALEANQAIQIAGFDTQFGKVAHASPEAIAIGVQNGDSIEGFEPAEDHQVLVHLLRNGSPIKVTLPLENGRATRLEMEWDPEIDAATLKVLERWLDLPKP